MKGISYEYVAQDLSNKSPELLKYNPVHKKVPVLLHNGNQFVSLLLFSSTLVKPGNLVLLCWPKILMPEPPLISGHNSWTIRSTHSLICDLQCYPAIWKIRGSEGEEQEKTIEEATEHLKTLENELKAKKFFGGDEIGLVDITGNLVELWLGVLLELVGINLLTKEKFPRLSEWIDDFLGKSIVKETLPAREDLLAFFRSLFQQSNSLLIWM